MLKFIHLKNYNIFDQLKLEEYLLKKTKDSWCIINEGTNDAIVLGVNNKPLDFLNILNIKKDNIAVIKRFSGGGTVFVDFSTIFVTFILSKDFLNIDLFPEIIMKWAINHFKKIFKEIDIYLIENDFVINNKKIAGNAQYIKKDRFLLHSSFLLDFDKTKMEKYLLLPKTAPKYRNARKHKHFLTSLKNIYTKDIFVQKIKDNLQKIYKLIPVDLLKISKDKMDYSTKIITF